MAAIAQGLRCVLARNVCAFRTLPRMTAVYVQQKYLHQNNLLDTVQRPKLLSGQLTLDSHFMNDLGLDSLDHVEVIMAMEDEFGFEIPDSDAEKLVRPADIVRYIADKEDVYE